VSFDVERVAEEACVVEVPLAGLSTDAGALRTRHFDVGRLALANVDRQGPTLGRCEAWRDDEPQAAPLATAMCSAVDGAWGRSSVEWGG